MISHSTGIRGIMPGRNPLKNIIIFRRHNDHYKPLTHKMSLKLAWINGMLWLPHHPSRLKKYPAYRNQIILVIPSFRRRKGV
jgi:hypothetical protein